MSWREDDGEVEAERLLVTLLTRVSIDPGVASEIIKGILEVIKS